MITNSLIWLGLNVLTIIILAYYSMIEMACVSFNKVRLHYYVQKNIKAAIWLNKLLEKPSTLFGTTLIGVNVAMVTGSECSRQFHEALGISPDLAPLSQVVIVMIFGELAPMFAARLYSEHVVLLGMPILYFSAKVLTPILWVIGFISEWTTRLFRAKIVEPDVFLSQEELQKLIGESEEEKGDSKEFDTVTSSILSLKQKSATAIMTPVRDAPKLPSSSTVGHMRKIMQKIDTDFFCIFHHTIHHIVGIVFAMDIIKLPDNKKLREHVKSPWFILEDTPLNAILQQFRSNNQTVAIILDKEGSAIGILHLDDILDEIFARPLFPHAHHAKKKTKRWIIIDRTFPGNLKLKEFYHQYGVRLDPDDNLSLSELVAKQLGHMPEVGQSIFIDPFELIVKEASLLESKKITIKTRIS